MRWADLYDSARGGAVNFNFAPVEDPRVSVQRVAGKGRGLVATEGIAIGTVLLVERAVATGNWAELPAKLSVLRDARTRSLFDGTDAADPVEPVPLPEWPRTFPERTPDWKRAAHLNAFAAQELRDDDQSGFLGFESADSGMVAPLCSLVNHSCTPNLTRQIIGEFVILRTNRLVHAGDELTFGYCVLARPMAQRQEHLGHFGFACSCPRCELEAQAEPGRVAAIWETFQDPERIAKPSDLVRVAAQAREAVEEETNETVRSLERHGAALEVWRSLEQAIVAVVPEGPLRARVANEIVATALLAESQGQQDNFASGMAMYRDVADSVTTAVRAHRRALGGGADAWWVFVSRVLPDSIKDLARALQQGKGESEGDGLREASRSASPDRDASAPPRAQDENRAPNTQDWTDTNAVLMEEQKRREKEAAIWGSLLRKEAGAAASC